VKSKKSLIISNGNRSNAGLSLPSLLLYRDVHLNLVKQNSIQFIEARKKLLKIYH